MIYKRGKVWWADISVNGQRYRESLNTTDWREAEREQKKLIERAELGKVATAGKKFGRLGFTEASTRYLEDRMPHLAERTIQTERERVKPLTAYFGSTRLTRISPR